jgi:superfamily II DNA/RNA helicase
MPPEITRLTKQFLHDPVRIEAAPPATTAEGIAQHIVRVPAADPAIKRLALRALIGAADVKNGIVFCNRKSEVDVVAKSLKKHGFDASPIHGDLDQSQRTRTLEAFRRGDLKVLVASDVAARGLDIPDVSHIFNYDVPHHADDYVHRIGRTGRAGKTGQTFMIVTPADGRAVDKVVRLTGKAPDEVKLDVDWSQARTSPRPAGRRSESSPGRRDRSRGRPASETSVAPMTPIAAPVAREPEPVAPPLETRSVVAPHPEMRPPHETSGEQAERPRHRDRDHGRRERPPQRPAEDEHVAVVGFGSETPAFLARAIPVPASAED